MRSLPFYVLLSLAMTACMAGGGSAAEQTGGVRIENGPRLSAPRATHQLVSTGKGQLLAIGGCVRAGCEVGPASATVDIIDASTMALSGTGHLLAGRIQPSAAALPDGRVLVLGGSDERDYGGKLRSVERFDLATERFVAAGNLADPRFKIADGLLLLPGNRVLVAAGNSASEIFDVADGTGTRLDYDLGGRWNYMTLVRADAHTALLAGGYREGRIEPTDRSWIIHLSKG